MNNEFNALYWEISCYNLPCGNFKNLSGASSWNVKERKKLYFQLQLNFLKNIKMLSSIIKPEKTCNVSIPAITAFVEATAGIILFTTPETQVR